MISVRPFAPPDASAVAALMLEMTRFYGVAVDIRRDIGRELPDQAGRFDIILAYHEEELAGFATFAAMFPVEAVRPFVHVHQVYVGNAGRRLGVATRLLTTIARTARERGCERLEWTTSTDNAAARALYDGLGAVASPKVLYVLDAGAFDRLAGAST